MLGKRLFDGLFRQTVAILLVIFHLCKMLRVILKINIRILFCHMDQNKLHKKHLKMRYQLISSISSWPWMCCLKPQYKLHSRWKRNAKPLLTLMIRALFHMTANKKRRTNAAFRCKIHYSYYRTEVSNKMRRGNFKFQLCVRCFETTMSWSLAAIWLAMNGSMQKKDKRQQAYH